MRQLLNLLGNVLVTEADIFNLKVYNLSEKYSEIPKIFTCQSL